MGIKRIRGLRPSGPAILAFGALFVALSGAAVALPGTNKVDSGDIKNGAITKKDISKGTKAAFSKPGPAGPQPVPHGPAGPAGAPVAVDSFSFQENATSIAGRWSTPTASKSLRLVRRGRRFEHSFSRRIPTTRLCSRLCERGGAAVTTAESTIGIRADILDLDSMGFTNDSETGVIAYQSPSTGGL